MQTELKFILAFSAACASSSAVLFATAAMGANPDGNNSFKASGFASNEIRYADPNVVNGDEARRKKQANPAVVERMSALKQTAPLSQTTHAIPRGVGVAP